MGREAQKLHLPVKAQCFVHLGISCALGNRTNGTGVGQEAFTGEKLDVLRSLEKDQQHAEWCFHNRVWRPKDVKTSESETAPPRHHWDTTETPPRHRDTTKIPPRHHRDTADETPETPETPPPRHHQDTTETLPRHHHRDTTKIPPRYHRDTTETPPRHRDTAQAGSREPDGARPPLELTIPSYRYWGTILQLEPSIQHTPPIHLPASYLHSASLKQRHPATGVWRLQSHIPQAAWALQHCPRAIPQCQCYPRPRAPTFSQELCKRKWGKINLTGDTQASLSQTTLDLLTMCWTSENMDFHHIIAGYQSKDMLQCTTSRN